MTRFLLLFLLHASNYISISASLTVEESTSRRAGLMSKLSFNCSACEESSPLLTSGNISKRGKSYDVNRRAVYHSIESAGTGYEGLASFCGVMNMPCLSTRAYYKQVDSILDVLEKESKIELLSAGQRLRQAILQENDELDCTMTLDAAVSFDGTWAKRGFT